MVDASPSFPMLLQRFFVDYLRQQRAVSSSTVAAYRDTFKLLLAFAEKEIRKTPTDFALADLDATLILAFLDHLERERKNTVRSRNARLSAIRSFLKYAAHEDLTALAVIERSLAVPQKRHDSAMLGFLTGPEIEAIMAAPDCATWAGRRDQALFMVLLQHRSQGVRSDRPAGRRRGAGRLASRSSPWQREKTPKRPTLEGNGRDAPTVASPPARR
jgi:integrase/recombinase XerD